RATNERPVIAIDGPAGSGKSTLARALAAELRLPYVNTGLMYRWVAARSLADRIDVQDELALARVAERAEFSLSEADVPELLIGGGPPDASLTASEVEDIVSAVSRHPRVRAVLRERQRALGRNGCVMEGRDIGTVVFPDADVKIFLSADPQVRVARRRLERIGAASAAEAAVVERDARDHRTNPLEPAADAIVLDSSRLGPDEVLGEALRLVRERVGTWR
ncbi:MAG: (d)CMP kinase, partial [Actinomycetota bacterium]